MYRILDLIWNGILDVRFKLCYVGSELLCGGEFEMFDRTVCLIVCLECLLHYIVCSRKHNPAMSSSDHVLAKSCERQHMSLQYL